MQPGALYRLIPVNHYTFDLVLNAVHHNQKNDITHL